MYHEAMATTKTTTVPASITTWIAARTEPTKADLLRGTFADNVHLSFAGRHRTGVDAVAEYLLAGPSSGLASAEHTVIARGENRYTVRFTGKNGAPMPSPGGPMAAMDFEMTLDDDGLIVSLSPNPQHTEPADLALPLAVGSVMPHFALPDTDGVVIDWYDASAAAHVILFTCNGCPWALGWHDRIQDVVREYKSRGVRTIQINANDPLASPADTPETSRSRVAKGDFAGPYLIDEGQRIAKKVGGRHTPDIYVVAADGTVAYHGAPDADSETPALRAEWLRAALDATLDGRPVELADTEPIGCTIKWTL